MFLKVLISLLCIGYVACVHLPQAKPCNNTEIFSENVKMEVSDCTPAHENCPLFRGSNHTVVFTFAPTVDFVNRMDSRVYGVFEKFSVPYGKKGNACEGVTDVNDNPVVCEEGQHGFLAGHTYKHVSKFAVSNNYPMIKLKVRFVFYDRRTKKNLMCMEVPVEIMNHIDPSSNEA